MLTVCLGVVLSGLDGVIVNVALPSIAADLGASPSATVWVATTYQLAVIVALLPFAALGERLGFRRIYLAGMAVFILGSLACALSGSLGLLLAARIVQGLGGGAMIGVSMALVRFTYPPNRLGSALALYGMTAAVSLTLGPSVAAAILALGPWPWLFAVNLPIGVLALALGLRFLPAPPRVPRELDVAAALLSAVMFICLVSGVDALGDRAELPRAGLLLAAALGSGWLLMLHQRPKATPLLPLDLLRDQSFSLAAATSVGTYAAQTSAFVALPFLFQHAFARSAVESGLLMTPWPLMIVLSAPVSGRLADRLPAGALTGVGLVGLALGLVLLAFTPPGASDLGIALRMILCGLGVGLFQAPNNRAIMTAAPPARSGAASAMVAVARLLGQALGSAAAAMALAGFAASGPRVALEIAATLAATACALSVARALSPGRAHGPA